MDKCADYTVNPPYSQRPFPMLSLFKLALEAAILVNVAGALLLMLSWFLYAMEAAVPGISIALVYRKV